MTEKRVKSLQSRLEKGQAALIVSEANRFYLTGFHSSDGFVFVTADSADFFVDFRYCEMAKSAVSSCSVTLSQKPLDELRELINKHSVKRMFVETATVSIAEFERYKAALDGVEIPSDSFLDNILCELRSQKSRSEIEYIREAQRMTDETFAYILGSIAAGRTEREIMLDMEFYMRRMGSEGVSFDFIVVSGKKSSLPHGVPSDKIIERGDFITMDFGAVVNGYRSDMTRTVAVGEVSGEQKRVYDTVLAAQNAAFSKIAPGVVCSEVDKAARDLIDSAGYNGCFGHALGHSVGIEIHENPTFSPRCKTELKEGMVITVEPGIYLENRFGVRIEDMICVTESGFENLTKSEKNLIIL